MSKFITVLKKLFWCFTNINSHNCSYKIVSLIGVIIRVVLLPYIVPNIFEEIASFFISQLHFPTWLYEALLRLFLFFFDAIALSRIFYWFSFITVGNSYESGTIPAWGSICYTIFYVIYSAIPIILFNYFFWWVIAVTFLGYLVICVAIYLLSAKFDTLPDIWIFRASAHGLGFALIVTSVCLMKHFI